MTEELKKTIEKEIAELPKEAQEVINGLDWVKIIEEIGQQFSLEEDEINNLQIETLLVLIGVTDPEFYATNIENNVETTKDMAENIAQESLQKIFTPIRKILKENIKKNIKNENPDWKQNINFILSGGDYGVFLDTPEATEFTEENTPKIDTGFITKKFEL